MMMIKQTYMANTIAKDTPESDSEPVCTVDNVGDEL